MGYLVIFAFQVWNQFENTRRDILDVLDYVYYQLPNVTVTCYDYPYNITIEPGIIDN